MIPAIGEVITVPYPFVRDTYIDHQQDDGEWSSVEVPTWRPGVRPDELARDSDCVADAMGAQILTVHGVYKPEGRYRARVFYTRRWRDPDGREFGKGTLHIKGISAFSAMASGYRHNFDMSVPQEQEIQ